EFMSSTDPWNRDTDGDDIWDGKDGWAGNVNDASSNLKQAKLAPPRIPVDHYALIDLGVGFASMINSRGDVVFWNGSTPKILLQGEVKTITAGDGGVSISDLNDSGVVCGIQKGGNVFTWTDGTSKVVSVPVHTSKTGHPYQVSNLVPPYFSVRLSNAGDVYAAQGIDILRNDGMMGAGNYGYGYYEDMRFANLTSQVTYGYFYEEYTYWEENGNAGLDFATNQDLITIPNGDSPYPNMILVAPRFISKSGNFTSFRSTGLGTFLR
ncbi:MAG: hypothetical protein WCG52_07025, partial [bacterium]